MLAFVARFAYRTANSVVCVSEPLAQDVSQSIRRPTTVIPNFLPGSEVDPPVRSEPGRLIMIGSLTPTKNHLTALDAVARLSMLESRLVIAGEGPYLARLRSRAEALGILDRVEFLGHVEQERLRLEVSRASCVLHTSVGETFGYAYFDGARSSRPVVAVTNPVAAWLIPTYIVGELAINDESSIAAAIKRVLEDPPSPDMFERARSRRDQVFSPSSIVDKWVRELKPL